MSVTKIDYKPPPTIKAFIKDFLPGELFHDWIIGPVGSGKTTGIFFKLLYMAKLQEPSPDGIRRSKAVIVRNTMPQLKDTTLASWRLWFRDGEAGQWLATQNTFILRFDDVECEVLFRPLDTADDIARVLSLEVTFALIDEFVEIPRAIIEALAARVGRYKLPDGTKTTNWGMWGSSNPSTEDNWWYDYLHNPETTARMSELIGARNVRYFHQPSALGPDAENLDNLPGNRGYYTSLLKGKSHVWVKQFLEAEWGFSVSGQPVVPSFRADLHLSMKALKYDPNLLLIGGYDPGMGGSAMIFGQEDTWGRMNVLGEIVTAGMGADRFCTDRVKPYLRNRFPGARFIIAPDPAARNRTPTDERTVVKILEKHFTVDCESNNRFPLRLNAIEHFTARLTDVGPALQIDAAQCPILTRALKGGWRYEFNQKKDTVTAGEPEKNKYSHPGDGFGYLCRYFHRRTEREQRRSEMRLPRQAGSVNQYHFR